MDLHVTLLTPSASEFSMPSKRKLKINALAGGVGASKLLLGLYEVMDPSLLTIIVNTGDDIVLHGLKISPENDVVAGVDDDGQQARDDIVLHSLKISPDLDIA